MVHNEIKQHVINRCAYKIVEDLLFTLRVRI